MLARATTPGNPRHIATSHPAATAAPPTLPPLSAKPKFSVWRQPNCVSEQLAKGGPNNLKESAVLAEWGWVA